MKFQLNKIEFFKTFSYSILDGSDVEFDVDSEYVLTFALRCIKTELWAKNRAEKRFFAVLRGFSGEFQNFELIFGIYVKFRFRIKNLGKIEGGREKGAKAWSVFTKSRT